MSLLCAKVKQGSLSDISFCRIHFAQNYLKKYYRLVTPDKTVVEGSPAENLRDGMRMLQKMAGLKETGEIDEPTARAMTWPRCGNTDNVTVQVSEEALRKKRYVVSGKDYKWNRLDLTFK